MAMVPSRPTAITPPDPPSRTSCACTTSSAACCTPRPRCRISDAISCATAARMKYSPWPVADTAQQSSAAYVPAPMIGVSPTRPARLPVMPPVDVAAARWPCASSATAPTVPSEASSPTRASPARCRSSSARRRSVVNQSFGTDSRPASAASASAPGPASITCGVCSITCRASRTGLRTCRTPATAPARRSRPSMIAASSSCPPSAQSTAPRPALNSGSSSSATTAAVTASRLEPPPESTA